MVHDKREESEGWKIYHHSFYDPLNHFTIRWWKGGGRRKRTIKVWAAGFLYLIIFAFEPTPLLKKILAQKETPLPSSSLLSHTHTYTHTCLAQHLHPLMDGLGQAGQGGAVALQLEPHKLDPRVVQEGVNVLLPHLGGPRETWRYGGVLYFCIPVRNEGMNKNYMKEMCREKEMRDW